MLMMGLLYVEHIVEKDPSVGELADLPLGWHAWRANLTRLGLESLILTTPTQKVIPQLDQ